MRGLREVNCMIGPVIAVIDEDQSFIDMAHALLSAAGYHVISWTDTYTAYEYVRQHPPEVIILDPAIGSRRVGGALLELLVRDAVTAQIPLILCSTDEPTIMDKDVELDSMYGFLLRKPITPDAILEAVSTLLKP
jgi:CheY-like chemotaxis protein